MWITITVETDQPEEVAAVDGWFERWDGRLSSVSENLGCGCCVDIWTVDAPEEALGELPKECWAPGVTDDAYLHADRPRLSSSFSVLDGPAPSEANPAPRAEPLGPSAGVIAGVVAACTAILVFAFIAAPRSCDWGLNAYAWFGLLMILGLAATPFLREPQRALPTRLGHATLLALLGIAFWTAGLFASNMRIVCRLF